jgi:glutamate synthase (ferredoxin)
VIDNDQLAKLRHVYEPGFRSITLPMLFDPRQDGPGLERAIEDLKKRASDAVDAGYTILILSDRATDRDRAPIPSLLATAGVHHHLVRQGTRTRCGLVVESGDAREVHHCALLLGYGAGVVNPYLAFETLDDMIHQRLIVGVTHEQAVERYIHALNKGILKVMSKMGISTLQSYCGAQIFEAVGLDRAFVDRYFTWTTSSCGIGIRSSPRKCSSGTGARTQSGGGNVRAGRRRQCSSATAIHSIRHGVPAAATRSGRAPSSKVLALVDDQSRQQ